MNGKYVMRQGTPHPLPVLDYGRPPRGIRWLAIMKGVTVGLAGVMILLQFRLFSFALLVLRLRLVRWRRSAGRGT